MARVRRNAEQEGVALAATAAQRGRAEPAAAAPQLERQGQRKPGARRADRVAEGDRAAVDVDPVQVDAEQLRGVDADRRERLVDLDQVEVVDADGPARPAPW